MTTLELSYAEVLHNPGAVDKAAEACYAQLPADAVLEIDSLVVNGGTGAILIGHALARQLECSVTLAGLESGIMYIEPSLSARERVVVLSETGGSAADLSALCAAIERTTPVLAVCVMSGDQNLTISAE